MVRVLLNDDDDSDKDENFIFLFFKDSLILFPAFIDIIIKRMKLFFILLIKKSDALVERV
jgi:hypothetical protein